VVEVAVVEEVVEAGAAVWAQAVVEEVVAEEWASVLRQGDSPTRRKAERRSRHR
jgi:hypothetical protein